MTHKLNAEGTALVSTEVFWIPIDENTPTGAKCLVIEKAQGIGYLREYWPGHGWDHYYPMPRFRKEPPCPPEEK